MRGVVTALGLVLFATAAQAADVSGDWEFTTKVFDEATYARVALKVLPALARGGYAAVAQQTIGTRCGGGTHKVDDNRDPRRRPNDKGNPPGNLADAELHFTADRSTDSG